MPAPPDVLIDGTDVVVTYTGGAATFTYTLSDGTSSDTASVTLNSGPVVTGTPGTLTLTEDVSIGIYDDTLIALAGVTDPNGDNLYIRSYGINPNVQVNDYNYWWDPEYAEYGSIPLDFNGATTLTFTITDGNAVTDLTVTINVTVTPVNDGPRDTTPVPGHEGFSYPTDGIYAGTEDTALVISIADLLGDDVDPEGDDFEFSTWSNTSFGYISHYDEVAQTLTFTPYANLTGEGVAFYYRTVDEFGAGSGPIAVIVNLAPTDDAPIAGNDTLTKSDAGEQTITAIEMLGNDTEYDLGDSLDIIAVSAVNGIESITLNADDSVVIDYGTYTGRASYTYTVQDETGLTSTATVFLNRAPVATNDGPFVLNEGDNAVFIPFSALLGNDFDPDGDPLSAQIYNYGYGGSNVFAQYVYDAASGEYGFRATLYDPTYTGPAQFQYWLWDGDAYSNVATVTLDVVAGNDAPVAAHDYWYYNGVSYYDTDPATNPMAGVEDGVIEFAADLLINGQFIDGAYQIGADTDEEGDALSIVASSLASSWGTVELFDNDGEDWIRFTPNPDLNSTDYYYYYSVPNFTYRVTDGSRESNAATVYLHVAAVNDTPVANDDAFTAVGDGPFLFNIDGSGSFYDVLANDSSPDDWPFGICPASRRAHAAPMPEAAPVMSATRVMRGMRSA
ncbi:tandem-95 repeat protein [Leptolyngbya sp. 15MV]|nr:tandem-95 repeat protein [Leptolyngbya sp. 15MV]